VNASAPIGNLDKSRLNAEPQVLTLARQEGEVAKVGTLAQQEEAAEMLVLRPEVSKKRLQP
jgi:hypothetical protein